MTSTSHAGSIGPWLNSNLDKFYLSDPLPVLVEWMDYRLSLVRHADVIVDLGGGVNGLNGFLSLQGKNVTSVDLFDEYYKWSSVTDPVLIQKNYLASLGVNFIHADLVTYDLLDDFAPESVDCVVSYHTLEHLHHSPRRLLESALQVLKPGGTLLIEVPNAANLLKRIKLLSGKTNYPDFPTFYEKDQWVGHVREYTVGDLQQTARRLKLSPYRIEGRNWYGSLYRNKLTTPVAKPLDKLLQWRPGLCGSLFLIGNKSAVGGAGKKT